MKEQEHLQQLLEDNIPTLILGLPGTGKTAYIIWLAKKLDYHLEIVIGSTLEPQDIAGVPIVINGEVKYCPPAWAKNIMEAHKLGKKSMLLLDELTCTPPAVQAPCLRLIQQKAVADWQLPDETRIVAAANPPEIAAGGWDISAPMANRVAHLKWNMDHETWIDYMLTLSKEKGRAAVAAFIRHRPAMLLNFPKQDQSGPWPSPRTWEMAARYVENNPALVASLVGEGPASELLSWQKSLDLPEPQVLLDNPTCPIPTRTDAAYAAISAAIALAIATKQTKKAWKLISRVANTTADIAAACARTLMIADKTIPDEIVSLLPALRRAKLV